MAKSKMDWAAKIAERIVVEFWEDIEGHWYDQKAPIAKLESRIARALRSAAGQRKKG
jgi:hypothetical protein